MRAVQGEKKIPAPAAVLRALKLNGLLPADMDDWADDEVALVNTLFGVNGGALARLASQESDLAADLLAFLAAED